MSFDGEKMDCRDIFLPGTLMALELSWSIDLCLILSSSVHTRKMMLINHISRLVKPYKDYYEIMGLTSSPLSKIDLMEGIL